MHQILGLRTRSAEGKERTFHTFFDKKWTVPSVKEILHNYELYLEKIPPEERFNLFFTAHHCVGMVARDWDGQDIIPFDIDNVPEEQSDLVADAVCYAIGADPKKVGAVRTGNGIQLVVEIERPIKTDSYFKVMRPAYNLLCTKIDKIIKEASLSGTADPAIFTSSRLLRFPGTINRKKKKGDKPAYVIRKNVEPHGWTLEAAVRIPGDTGSVPKMEYKSYPPADVTGVQEGCLFLKHAWARPDELSEEQWYAMIGILGHMPTGRKLAHDYSKRYSAYSEKETDAKLDHALAASGPRTCENINTLWPGCRDCPHFKTKLKSPICIQSDDYIATESTFLWHVDIGANGQEKRRPAYEDIVKYWKKKKGPIVTGKGGILWSYDKEDNTWSEIEDMYVRSFIHNAMEPKPNTGIVEEALKKLKYDRVVGEEFFGLARGCVNLTNGVFDIGASELKPFSKDYGFKNNLGYAFDPDAKCPAFMKFLDDLFPKDKKAIEFIQEFMGYIVSGDPCWLHKAAVFIGEGRNGKSTLNDVIRHIVGEKNVSSVTMKKLSDPTMFQLTSNALVNLADESSVDSIADSEVLKSAVSGGDVMVKKLYVQPFTVKNKAKFIFNCNSMPYSKDTSEGLYRRLVMISFDAEFDEKHGNVDVFILEKLLKELPGILNFAIGGYRRLKKEKRFTEPDSAIENMEIFKDAQNDVEDWFDERIILGEGGFISSSDAYKSYIHYCDDIGKRNRTPSTPFYKKVSTLFARQGIECIRGTLGNRRTRGYVAKIRDGETRF